MDRAAHNNPLGGGDVKAGSKCIGLFVIVPGWGWEAGRVGGHRQLLCEWDYCLVAWSAGRNKTKSKGLYSIFILFFFNSEVLQNIPCPPGSQKF